MDRVVRHAIEQGLRPVTAIQMATLNTAQHFGLEKDIGSITPGRYADIILTSDLSSLPIETVIAAGDIVAQDGKLEIEIAAYPYPAFALGTVKLPRKLTVYDFDVPAPSSTSTKVRVIGVVENQAPTRALTRVLPVESGVLQLDSRQDINHLALIERHSGQDKVVNGFVTGFGFNIPCGMASTIAHDSHNMVVVGTSRTNMVAAVNRLNQVGGGVVVYKEGEEIALLELPIAGLMSNERAELVAEKTEKIVAAFRACGCEMNNAFMQMSLMALVVIPELRISDLGLVDVNQFEIVPLIVE